MAIYFQQYFTFILNTSCHRRFKTESSLTFLLKLTSSIVNGLLTTISDNVGLLICIFIIILLLGSV